MRKTLTSNEIVEISQTQTDMNALVNRGNYESANQLIGYWKMNEEGDLLSDAVETGTLEKLHFQSGQRATNVVAWMKVHAIIIH